MGLSRHMAAGRLWEVGDHYRSKMHETCLIIILDPGMRPGPESNRGPLD